MLSGRGGPRPSRIRPPRRMLRQGAGTADGSEIEECWTMLRDAITDIHNKDCSQLLFEQLYRAAYKIVLKKKGSLLYDRVNQFEETWFKENVIPKIEALVTSTLVNVGLSKTTSTHERRQMGEMFLRGLRDAWRDHNTSMNMVADVLMYLDRGYTQDGRRPSIFTSTIGLFRDQILKTYINGSVCIDVLNSVILDQIEMERDGDVIDQALIKNCVTMLDDLYETDTELPDEKLYLTVFQPQFIAASREFYKRESQQLLSQADAPTWLRHTERRLQEEASRCTTTLLPETLPAVTKEVEKELIKAHLDEFLAVEGSGLRWMLDNDKTDDLAILYSLISRVDPSKASLKRGLQNKVLELGREIEKVLKETDFSIPSGAQGDGEDAAAEGGERPKTSPVSAAAQLTAAAIKWVADVLRLKDKFDHLWKSCFNEDLIIQTALTKSFADFINTFPRCSEYVSLFIDDNLRKGIRGKTEVEIDAIIEKAITLIRYLQQKDLFERHYQKHLARRLLYSRSESHDVEKQMLSRMKQDFGNQFTAKFEGMFRDMDTSAELTTNYRDHIRALGDSDRGNIDVAINILTTTAWPPDLMGRGSQFDADSIASCNWPLEIQKLHESITAYYLTNRSGRKLTWMGSQGSADIRCTFPAIPGKTGPLARERRYEINMSTYGMMVLYLFNDLGEDTSLSLEEIQAKTNIGTNDLAKTLMSLSIAPKCRVLLKEPATKVIKPGDTFRFNKSFVSKAVRIKAPIVTASSKLEGEEERKTTEEKNNQTRAHVIDAAIVRIMKQRKELGHAQLITEVINQLVGRFKPEVGLLKKRIEDLISREYLERIEDATPGMYRYLA